MTLLFSGSGGNNNVSVSSPSLEGLFVSGIDQKQVTDGLGVIIPWGGGSSLSQYSTSDTTEGSTYDTLLSSLGSSSSPASAATFNVEGLMGPQGERGQQGIQGVQGLPGTIAYITIGASGSLATLEDALGGADINTITYISDVYTEWNITWEKLNIDSGANNWNSVAMSNDCQYMIIGADEGLYFSTLQGAGWLDRSPSAELFGKVSMSGIGREAIALGETDAALGKFWASADYGANWSEITISVE